VNEARERRVESAHDLYDLPLDEFVAARNALAKQLRGASRRDEAKRVAELRRPTRAAWGLNQVARREPTIIEGAVGAGRALGTAMVGAMTGEGGSNRQALRDAQTEERAALDRVWDAVVRAFREHGDDVSGDDALRRHVTDTVRAAVSDDEVTEAMRSGELSVDHEPPAFGFGPLTALAGPPPSTPKPKASTARSARVGSTTDRGDAARSDKAEQADKGAGKAGKATEKHEIERRERERRDQERRDQERRDQERREQERREQQAEVDRLAKHVRELAGAAADAADAAKRAQQLADEAAAEIEQAKERLDALTR
jgi:hypothetical protein